MVLMGFSIIALCCGQSVGQGTHAVAAQPKNETLRMAIEITILRGILKIFL
jgi:hypothetical protein